MSVTPLGPRLIKPGQTLKLYVKDGHVILQGNEVWIRMTKDEAVGLVQALVDQINNMVGGLK